MKHLLTYFFVILSLICKAQYISKINVFHIQKGGFRFARIDENNISLSATTIFTINDTDCISKIDSLLKGASEVRNTLKFHPIFMLCEIIYTHGDREILVFEDRLNGKLKFGGELLNNIKGLEGVIFFCNPNRVQALQ